jgi:hypothetical protein
MICRKIVKVLFLLLLTEKVMMDERITAEVNVIYPNRSDPYRLSNAYCISKSKCWSQINQDLEVSKLLQGMRNGFFMEAGGFDGETHSNSLYFEKYLDWNGILIEANPRLCSHIIRKCRKSMLVCGGISTNNETTLTPFVFAGALGGMY